MNTKKPTKRTAAKIITVVLLALFLMLPSFPVINFVDGLFTVDFADSPLVTNANAAYSASGSGTWLTGKLEYTWSAVSNGLASNGADATVTPNEGASKLTITATNSKRTYKYVFFTDKEEEPTTNTVTVTNVSRYPLLINSLSLTKDKNTTGTYIESSAHVNDVIDPGSYFTITVYAAAVTSATKVTGTAVIEVEELKNVNVTLKPSVHTSYTVDGHTVEQNGSSVSFVKEIGDTITLPELTDIPEGYVFKGWHTGSGLATGEYEITAATTLTPAIVSANAKIDTANFMVGTTPYTFWEDAVTAAAAGTKVVIVNDADAWLPSNVLDNLLPASGGTYVKPITGGGVEYIIPSGITLQLPYAENTQLHTTSYEYSYEEHVVPYSFRSLTVPGGARITVNGAVSVDSRVCAIGQGNKSWNGTPTGPHGMISLKYGSEIVLNSGANLYCYGYINGDGDVTVKSGANVYELFQFRSWRGGQAAVAMLENSQRVFPMNQYYVQNVEAPMTLYKGATEYVSSVVNMSSAPYPTSQFVFIGTNGMFTLTDKSTDRIVKSYNAALDRLDLEIHGDMTMNSLNIQLKNLPLYGTKNMYSSSYVLPINDMHIDICEGTSTVASSQQYGVAFLPDSKLTVAEGASFTIDVPIYVYDVEEWRYRLDGGDSGNERVSAYYAGSSLQMIPVGYSTANGENVMRSIDNMKDAEFDINGTLTVGSTSSSKGRLYTTASGANITSSGSTGKIVFNSTPETSQKTTYQMTQADTDMTPHSITVNNAWLKNGDGSYSQTVSTVAATWLYDAYGRHWYRYMVDFMYKGSLVARDYYCENNDTITYDASWLATLDSNDLTSGSATVTEANKTITVKNVTQDSVITLAGTPYRYIPTFVLNEKQYSIYQLFTHSTIDTEPITINEENYYIVDQSADPLEVGESYAAPPDASMGIVAAKKNSITWNLSGVSATSGNNYSGNVTPGTVSDGPLYIYGFYSGYVAHNHWDDQYYTTLIDAFAALPQDAEATIDLLADCGTFEDESKTTVYSSYDDNNITLNLNGYKAFGRIINDGIFTLNMGGGSLEYISGAASASAAYKGLAAIKNEGTLTVSDSVGGGKIITDIIEDDSKLFSSYAAAVRNNEGATATISNVWLDSVQNVNAYTPAFINSGTATVTDVKLTATYYTAFAFVNTETGSLTIDTCADIDRRIYNKGECTLDLKGHDVNYITGAVESASAYESKGAIFNTSATADLTVKDTVGGSKITTDMISGNSTLSKHSAVIRNEADAKITLNDIEIEHTQTANKYNIGILNYGSLEADGLSLTVHRGYGIYNAAAAAEADIDLKGGTIDYNSGAEAAAATYQTAAAVYNLGTISLKDGIIKSDAISDGSKVSTYFDVIRNYTDASMTLTDIDVVSIETANAATVGVYNNGDLTADGLNIKVSSGLSLYTSSAAVTDIDFDGGDNIGNISTAGTIEKLDLHGGAIGGYITNSGTIGSLVGAGSVAGNITNTGTITSFALGSGGTITGNLANSGTIQSFDLNGGTMTGTVTNNTGATCTIDLKGGTVTAAASTSNAAALITNSAELTVTSTTEEKGTLIASRYVSSSSTSNMSSIIRNNAGSNLTISNCHIENTQSSKYNYSAVLFNYGGTADITDCKLVTARGRGIYNNGSGVITQIKDTDITCTVAAGSYPVLNYGDIQLISGCNMSAPNVTVLNNNYSGSIGTLDNTVLTISAPTTAKTYVVLNYGAEIGTMSNCTITGNSGIKNYNKRGSNTIAEGYDIEYYAEIDEIKNTTITAGQYAIYNSAVINTISDHCVFTAKPVSAQVSWPSAKAKLNGDVPCYTVINSYEWWEDTSVWKQTDTVVDNNGTQMVQRRINEYKTEDEYRPYIGTISDCEINAENTSTSAANGYALRNYGVIDTITGTTTIQTYKHDDNASTKLTGSQFAIQNLNGGKINLIDSGVTVSAQSCAIDNRGARIASTDISYSTTYLASGVLTSATYGTDYDYSYSYVSYIGSIKGTVTAETEYAIQNYSKIGSVSGDVSAHANVIVNHIAEETKSNTTRTSTDLDTVTANVRAIEHRVFENDDSSSLDNEIGRTFDYTRNTEDGCYIGEITGTVTATGSGYQAVSNQGYIGTLGGVIKSDDGEGNVVGTAKYSLVVNGGERQAALHLTQDYYVETNSYGATKYVCDYTYDVPTIDTINGDISYNTGYYAICNRGVINTLSGTVSKDSIAVSNMSSGTYRTRKTIKFYSSASRLAATYASSEVDCEYTKEQAKINLIDGATITATSTTSALRNYGYVGTIRNSTLISTTTGTILNGNSSADTLTLTDYSSNRSDVLIGCKPAKGSCSLRYDTAQTVSEDEIYAVDTIDLIGEGNTIQGTYYAIQNLGRINAIDSGEGTPTQIITNGGGAAVYNYTGNYTRRTNTDAAITAATGTLTNNYSYEYTPASIGTVKNTYIQSVRNGILNGNGNETYDPVKIEEIGEGTEVYTTGKYHAVVNNAACAQIEEISGGIFFANRSGAYYALCNTSTTYPVKLSGGDFRNYSTGSSDGRTRSVYKWNDPTYVTYADHMHFSGKDGYSSAYTRTPENAVNENVNKSGYYYVKYDTHTITWKNGSTKLKDTKVDYNSVPVYDGDTPTMAQTAQYTYTFNGWTDGTNTYYLGTDLPPVSGDTTYTAVYSEELRSYSVTWNWNDDADDPTVIEDTVLYGETPVYDHDTPIKAQTAQYTYTFDHWSPEISQVNGDVVYTAVYTETLRKYTVTWNNWNGDNLETDEDVPYGTMPSYDGSTPERAGNDQFSYTFKEWSPEVETVTGNVTYTAVFNETTNSYKVTWKDVDGSPLDPAYTMYDYGEKPVFSGALPTKENTAQYTYTFKWSDGTNSYDADNLPDVTGSVTYTATFEETLNSYEVTWITTDENGVEHTNTVTYNYGETPAPASGDVVPTYKVNEETALGERIATYTFTGWSHEISEVTGEATYEAVYKPVFDQHSLAIEDSIDTNFYIRVPSGYDPAKLKVVFTWGKDNTEEADPPTTTGRKQLAATGALADAELLAATGTDDTTVFTYTDDSLISAHDGLWKATVPVAAKEMNDLIRVVLKDTNNQTVAEETYKSTDYLYTVIDMDNTDLAAITKGKSPAKLKELCKSTLAYGSAAQMYFGYNTEDLADKYLVTGEENKTDPRYYEPDYSVINTSTFADYYDGDYLTMANTDLRENGMQYYGTSLSLEHKLEYNMFFQRLVSYDVENPLVAELRGDAISKRNIEGVLVDSNEHAGDQAFVRFDITGIAPADLLNDYVIKFPKQNPFKVNVRTYMYVAMYYADYFPEDQDIQNLGKAVQTLYLYSLKADSYFNGTNGQ